MSRLEEIRRSVDAADEYPKLIARLAEIGERMSGRVVLDGVEIEAARKVLADVHRAYGAICANQCVGGDASDASFDLSALREEYDVDFLNQEFAFVMIGKNAVVLWQRPGALDDELRFLSIDTFRAFAQNSRHHYEDENGKKRSISYADKWLGDPKRRTYAGLEFFPNPDGARGRPGYLNLWRGFAVKPSEAGSYAVFRDHLLMNVCHSNEGLYRWVFGWFAQIVQRPREKTGTALVLRGVQGSGKTTVGQVFGSLLPSHYVLADDARYLTGNFNAHMAQCLLLQADEGFWAGDKGAEGRLKGLVTSSTQMIEQKGVDPIQLDNHVRLLITSNHDWVVPAGKEERRFATLDVSDHCAQHHAYFAEMAEELDSGGRARLLHDLLAFDLSTVNLREIPKTFALLEQKIQNFDPIEAWLFDRLQAGAPTRGHSKWPQEVPRQKLFEDYIAASDRTGIHRKANEAQFGIKLKKLIPKIVGTRPRMATDDGTSTERVRCYALPPLADCRDAFEAAVQQPVVWDREDE